MRTFATVTLLLALSACRTDPVKYDTDGTVPTDDTATEPADADGDGFTEDVDCDDGDASIHPGAEELCDELDNDCNGLVDDDAVDAVTAWVDEDGDGWGDTDGAVTACELPSGYVDEDGDCDDGNAEIYPGAPERCDGLDNDCDGDVDEDLNEIWYADADGDGYGNAHNILESCDPGEGWVTDATDCDDANSSVHPGAEELCNDTDDDCDGGIDEELESSWYQDADGDGFGDPALETFDCEPGAGWVTDATDCDDANSAIHPDAQEACNGYDDDCDGLVDDQDDSVTGLTTWFLDADGDGYGDDASTAEACDQPSGHAAYGGDCDDADAAYNPGASEDDCTDPADYNCDGSTGYADDDGDGWAACEDCDDGDPAINADAVETCDNVDNDCDGSIDEDDASDASEWYADDDGDGFGDASSSTIACDQPSGHVSLTYATDCDDGDAAINPVAAESCDGVDNDCDGDVDEGVTDTYWADADGDGYGDASASVEACALPSGYAEDDTDCDDGDATVNPAASEICDGADNDCDGLVDDDDTAVSGTTSWYLDYDGDGYGNAHYSTTACQEPTGYVADDTDCDDTDASAQPGGEELCDGVDNDCDGDVDEDDASDAQEWFWDDDGDGYGDETRSTRACEQPSASWVADRTDCDDGNVEVNPGADEECDTWDNDCDGDVDEDDAVDASTWYADDDGDGYGDASDAVTACYGTSGYVSDSTDCDDHDATAHPGASEICDGVDNDCDGTVDEDDASDASRWYEDDDMDGYGDPTAYLTACDAVSGYVSDSTDCDDDDAAINPAADEICDGVDNDCDGTVDEDDAIDAATWYADADGDGFGDASTTDTACYAPGGYVSTATDCDDGDATVSPAATELCDGVDNDCDGDVDEDDAADVASWYADSDGDGYGDASSAQQACDQPSGYVAYARATDCDDTDGAVNPGAAEVCDGDDDDCDGLVDDDDSGVTGTSTWYIDYDADGYGSASYTRDRCTQPSGYVADGSDCDDTDSAVNPAADEACNGVDDDCDGDVDEDSAVDTTTFYADNDGDGYGASTSGTHDACELPSGYAADDTDCDDWDAGIHPGATETCNGVDDDCDGTADNGTLGSDATCAADSCEAILLDGASAGDGSYWLTGSTGDYQTHCDMSRDGGGWTFIGSVVNDGTRGWNDEAVWLTDTTAFGTLADRQAEDVKMDAYWEVEGWDLMVITDEYGFGFYDVLDEQSMLGFMSTEYTTSCSQTFLASGADWYETMSSSQALLHVLVVRPLDDNAVSCFPSGNENAILGFQLSHCCWANGLGNTPNGYPSWDIYDNSLLELSRLSTGSCSAGSYPCSDAGYYNAGTNCYDSGCKVSWAELYVR